MKRASPKTLAGRVRSRRREMDLTQQQLADQVGVRRKVVSMIENGHVTSPMLTTMAGLADALGVTRAELLELSGKSPRRVDL